MAALQHRAMRHGCRPPPLYLISRLVTRVEPFAPSTLIAISATDFSLGAVAIALSELAISEISTVTGFAIHGQTPRLTPN